MLTTTTFEAIFTKFWNEYFELNSVTFLTEYRLERQRQYPGVGFKPFTNWTDHKAWMRKKAQLQERNKRVLETYRNPETGRINYTADGFVPNE